MSRPNLRSSRFLTLLLCGGVALGACAEQEEPPGTEADQQGVGAQCSSEQDCEAFEDENETDEEPLICLDAFKGGYCGQVDCQSHDDCPDGSACVTHDDGVNYCFLVCQDKAECNVNRDADNESNCSANITWVGSDQGKACVPPSGA